MKIKKRIEILAELGHFLQTETHDTELETAIRQSFAENAWFTPENIRKALAAIATEFLSKKKLEKWLEKYPISDHLHPQKTVGLVMAGNIPLVGFHDWLCVFAAGQKASVKLSDKDKRLLPFLVKKLADFDFESWETTHFLTENERLAGFDAVIATGSNNTARYFEKYFGKYPHIIRRNRNGVAVLDGSETAADFAALGEDIFSFFGLGCRNVSKIYVPKNYNFEPLLEALHEFRELVLHDKYKNNFDYNMTLFILNKIHHFNNGCVIFREEKTMAARIASVHFEFYEDKNLLENELKNRRDEIQCIVSKTDFADLPSFRFGETQKPSLTDYPDGVDVMKFLTDNQPKIN